MNKPICLRLLILELSKTIIFEFQYDYVKLKYGEKANLRFIVHVKTDKIYKYIVEDVETRFDPSNYEVGRPLQKGKNKKSNWINER